MNKRKDCFWDKPGPTWVIITLILYSVLTFSLETCLHRLKRFCVILNSLLFLYLPSNT